MLHVNQVHLVNLQRAPLHKRLLVLLFLIVMACVLIPLGLAVILVLIVLYIVLSIVSMAMQVWRSITGSPAGTIRASRVRDAADNEGRQNVRVIVPERSENPSSSGPAA